MAFRFGRWRYLGWWKFGGRWRFVGWWSFGGRWRFGGLVGRCWLLGLEVGVGVCLGSLGLVWQHVSCSQLTGMILMPLMFCHV